MVATGMVFAQILCHRLTRPLPSICVNETFSSMFTVRDHVLDVDFCMLHF